MKSHRRQVLTPHDFILEPYARDAHHRTPREILSALAGQSTWRTPDSGGRGGQRPVLTHAAKLAWAIQKAKDPVGRALVGAIAMPDVADTVDLHKTCWPRVAELCGPMGIRRMLQTAHVLEDVLADMLRPGTRTRPSVRMRHQDYLRLHRDIHRTLDGLAMTAEREAVNALHAG